MCSHIFLKNLNRFFFIHYLNELKKGEGVKENCKKNLFSCAVRENVLCGWLDCKCCGVHL